MEKTRSKDQTLGGCLRTDCRYRWAARGIVEAGKLEQLDEATGLGAGVRRGPNRRCLTCDRRGLPPHTVGDQDETPERD